TVLNENDPPTLNYLSPQTAIEDVPYSLQLVAQDIDLGDTLTYSLVSSPSGMTLNQATGLISWRPMSDDIGTHTIIVRVTDASSAFAERTFQISVANVNDAPMITTASIPNATEGTMYMVTIHADDADGDALTFSLDSAPSFLWIDAKSALMYGIPGYGDAGAYQIVVIVSDGTTFVTGTFNLTVIDVNRLPVITSYPITVAKPGEEYLYAIAATDEDAGDMLTYSLSKAPEGMSIDRRTGRITWTPMEAQADQVYQVVVEVSDGEGSAVQSFAVTVEELPSEPSDYLWVGIVLFLVAVVALLSVAGVGRKQ
ncbi:MAG: putative Ig domain-containing protein, partial [Candidatus Thermoplasmatota archaeon]